jgi:hypothetical protein
MMPHWRRAGWLAMALILGLGAPARAQKPGQTFKSPLKNFTVVVPSLGLGPRVEKQNSKNDGRVGFYSDLGDLLRIDYGRLPADVTVPTDSTALHAFHRQPVDALVQASQGVLISERDVVVDGAPMLLAIVAIPGGSPVEVTTQDDQGKPVSKRMDSERGLLVFARGGFVYVLQAELTASVLDIGKAKDKPPPTLEEKSATAERMLPEFYRTITFL